ncbi:glycosyltransferase [uncultured Bacteroides sp.]|uniref:glycosyltransferase family 2 protein n=1 Tax=uncultured Bacteroides sp. TaxID=162156 RepID=UPI0025942EE4|nr:glycosyltransferase [uncultured Bacteroides sp.]
MILKPFFSFLLITYKQEQFVKDAFNACINQTYRDFEIIICDDNSPDNTFNILTKLVKEYKDSGGDIHIVLHQNKENKGIGGNFQQAAMLSQGQWLIMAAGDDISLPSRLETLKGIIDNNNNIYGINTARYFVDEHGRNPIYNFKEGYLLGADSVWHRSLFFDFQPLDKRVMSEDHILNLRAMLKGIMLQVNTPTIYYRISSQNYSMQKASNILEMKKAEKRKMEYHRNLLLFRLEDIKQWQIKGNDVSKAVKNKIYLELDEIDRKIASYQLFIDVAESNFYKKVMYLIIHNNIWLHNKLLYRIYNLFKMFHLISQKSIRKVTWNGVISKKDDRTIMITIKDFIERKELF